eukprot:6185630-Pleurochrysis_carterae.AAC.3
MHGDSHTLAASDVSCIFVALVASLLHHAQASLVSSRTHRRTATVRSILPTSPSVRRVRAAHRARRLALCSRRSAAFAVRARRRSSSVAAPAVPAHCTRSRRLRLRRRLQRDAPQGASAPLWHRCAHVHDHLVVVCNRTIVGWAGRVRRCVSEHQPHRVDARRVNRHGKQQKQVRSDRKRKMVSKNSTAACEEKRREIHTTAGKGCIHLELTGSGVARESDEHGKFGPGELGQEMDKLDVRKAAVRNTPVLIQLHDRAAMQRRKCRQRAIGSVQRAISRAMHTEMHADAQVVGHTPTDRQTHFAVVAYVVNRSKDGCGRREDTPTQTLDGTEHGNGVVVRQRGRTRSEHGMPRTPLLVI